MLGRLHNAERRRIVDALALMLFVGGAAGLLVGELGRVWWLFDLFSHFRLQYLVALAFACTGLALARRWKTGLAALALTLVAGWPILESYWAQRRPSIPGAERLRVGLFNVNFGNDRYGEIASFLRRQKLDLVVVQEATPGLEAELARAFPHFHRVERSRRDAFGMVLLSRLPVSDLVEHSWGPMALPAFELGVEFGGRELRVLAIHPIPPTNADNSSERDMILARAADWARGVGPLGIIVGDFNATPWSHPFERLLDRSGYLDSRQGFGPEPSWPSFWPLSIPIDHLLHGSSLTTLSRGTGPFTGSDHRPVIVELAPALP